MLLSIDLESEEAIYLQIRNEVIKGIAKGEIEEGDELPSVRALAEELGVNMHTVNKSYALLKEDGYLRMDRRKGAVIAFYLEETKGRFLRDVNKEMELLVGECINRGISMEELFNQISTIHKGYTS